MGKHFITADDLEGLPEGSELVIPSGAEITDWAREQAARQGIRMRRAAPAEAATASRAARTRIALASDHGGFELKQKLLPFLKDLGYVVLDLGPNEPRTLDYPDQALAVAEAVRAGQADFGIVIDGAGIGSAMAANKVPGIRAALCYDLATARNSREHNHANLLTLGGRLLSPELARNIAAEWLRTPWGSGRHAARVEKITAIEAKYAARGGNG